MWNIIFGTEGVDYERHWNYIKQFRKLEKWYLSFLLTHDLSLIFPSITREDNSQEWMCTTGLSNLAAGGKGGIHHRDFTNKGYTVQVVWLPSPPQLWGLPLYHAVNSPAPHRQVDLPYCCTVKAGGKLPHHLFTKCSPNTAAKLQLLGKGITLKLIEGVSLNATEVPKKTLSLSTYPTPVKRVICIITLIVDWYLL